MSGLLPMRVGRVEGLRVGVVSAVLMGALSACSGSVYRKPPEQSPSDVTVCGSVYAPNIAELSKAGQIKD